MQNLKVNISQSTRMMWTMIQITNYNKMSLELSENNDDKYDNRLADNVV